MGLVCIHFLSVLIFGVISIPGTSMQRSWQTPDICMDTGTWETYTQGRKDKKQKKRQDPLVSVVQMAWCQWSRQAWVHVLLYLSISGT